MADLAKLQRLALVSQSFTPSAPVGRLDMLAGRMAQLSDIVNTTYMVGQHVGLYGERGVGKTSLINVLHQVFEQVDQGGGNVNMAVINCTTDDEFESVWRSAFMDLGITIDDSDPQTFTPEGIRRAMQNLDGQTVVVLDELDRLDDDTSLTALADTIKTLSDHTVNTTIVLVGVAKSIGDLVGEHASIVRALAQIQMPRMSPSEIKDLVEKGCASAGVDIDDAAIVEVASLSEGLPHYAHLLGLHAARRVIEDDREHVRVTDVRAAIPRAVDRHTNVNAYQQATRSAHKDALFAEVLLACALAAKNTLGFFTSAAVREPLESITGRKLDIPAFSNHLSQFLEVERGSVLQREGTKRRYFYRFTDPIFQPYVVLHGLAEGRITNEQRQRFQSAPQPVEITAGAFENQNQQLF